MDKLQINKRFVRFLLWALINIQWAYFHISPRYVPFKFTNDGEVCFQDMKLNQIFEKPRLIPFEQEVSDG
jgi:hypothetical protein